MAMWTKLCNLATLCSQEWLLYGDFNVFMLRKETSGNNPTKLSMRKFNHFIQKHNLLDPTLINNKFTWSNVSVNPTCSGSFPLHSSIGTSLQVTLL